MRRFTELTTLILWALFLTVNPAIQDSRDEPQTVKYFDTDLKKQDLLDKEITLKEARQTDHFKVTYDAQGKILKMEYIPARRLRGKKMQKHELFPKPRPPFRYFEKWNPHTRTLDKEISEFKLGSRPFYRTTFEDEEHVRTVEYYRKRNNLLWTYYIEWDEQKMSSTLSVLFNSHLPLTALDPHLYHSTLSEMRPGWIAQFKHNRLGRPLNTTVKDAVGNIYYFYDFVYRFEAVGDSLLNGEITNENPPGTLKNYKITTCKYYRADSTFVGKHELTFDKNNSLVKKRFFNDHGELTETIEYEFNSELNEVTVLIRDPEGNIIHRQVMGK
ncbi:MAG: hypothetical protein ACE5EE_09805 [Fidelibacterota bacterium]